MYSDSADKPQVRIENWSVVDDVISPAYRELTPGYRLSGFIYRLRDLPSGVVYTSAILKVDDGGSQVETAEAVYLLGQVDRRYERWFLGSSVEDAA
ncbi:MAG TPA: hypothetical protein VMD25_04675 [Acidobacteriaceae bacterium]|nr:hypothetical protein [Acidobacteriaceae bacterium]